MKFFLVFALVAAVASATFTKPAALSGEAAEIQEIIAAINNPATNPATAAALEQMLQDILGVKPDPVIVVDEAPANDFVDIFPVVDPVAPSEDFVDIFPVLDSVAPAPAAASSTPLVQIILNINQAAAESSPVAPVVVPEAADIISPVEIVDNFPVVDPVIIDNFPVVNPVSPVQVVDVSPVQVVDVSPVQVVDVSPVQVVDAAPVAVEPVNIGTPVIPSPAVNLPESLN
ncbi:uncharacterized protein LOC142980079 isoform X1 [Anticarsia gemmatalis]|uniref:uncharacterized protein LOC142980079 isoform X1 n=1 Tax=Anticarsia gemmatalis TaxID=129554 RepID=UPI003F773E7F